MDRKTPDDGIYIGIDRRNGQRRSQADRRDSIRFELDKAPRRSGRDRRKNAGDPWARNGHR